MIQYFHVFKSYAGSGPPVLRDIHFEIAKGEFAFFTGPSGAGKSTLLKLLFRGESPTSGQVRVGGVNVENLRAAAVPYLRRNIGVVFQDFKLLAHRTVRDNIALALDVSGVPRKAMAERLETVLEEVGLSDRASALPSQLSGGEQQRAVIARALINEPELLLADEPTGNLDFERSVEILELLHQANRRGTTVVVATHDRSLIAHVPRRTVHLERGAVAFDQRQRA